VLLNRQNMVFGEVRLMDDEMWTWYFSRSWRMLFTLPVLLFFGLNTLFFALLIVVVEIDLLLWNFLVFFFLGLTIGWIISGIPAVISSLVWALLPTIWDEWRASSWVKAPTWIVLAILSPTVPWFISANGLNLLESLGMPLRATGWWIQLWAR